MNARRRPEKKTEPLAMLDEPLTAEQRQQGIDMALKNEEDRHRKNLKNAAERLRELAASVERMSTTPANLVISKAREIAACAVEVELATSSIIAADHAKRVMREEW